MEEGAMYGAAAKPIRKSQYGWDEYEASEDEPAIKNKYDILPELESELLDNGYFLKRRVWRQMKKMQKHTKKDREGYGYEIHKGSHYRHKPLHGF